MTPTATTPAVLAACLADVLAAIGEDRDALASPHGEAVRGGHVRAVPGGLMLTLADGKAFNLWIQPRKEPPMDDLAIDGTRYPLAFVREALRTQSDAARLRAAAVEALAVADVQRAARGRLSHLDTPIARRLLAALDDAEAQAWAQLGSLLGTGVDDGPRVPRRD